jgi:hypothetical protein
MPSTKPFRSSKLLAMIRSAASPSARSRRAKSRPKNVVRVRTPAATAADAGAGAGSIPSTGMPWATKFLSM